MQLPLCKSDACSIAVSFFCIVFFYGKVKLKAISIMYFFYWSWMYGETGCKLFAIVSLLCGIEVIFSLFLMILDIFFLTSGLQINKSVWTVAFIPGFISPPLNRSHSLILSGISWLFALLFVIPPSLNIYANFGLEPSGTSCGIDYWHGNINNYHNYAMILVFGSYMLPISSM